MIPPVFGDEIVATFDPKATTKVPVFQGKAFGQYTDRGEHPIQVYAPLDVVLEKEKWNPSIAYYRLGYRSVASSTNERTLICAILPPNVISNHSIGIETSPQKHPSYISLSLTAILNSFFADWQVRQKSGANISAFIFRATRVPANAIKLRFLVHSVLRLICNHSRYKALWHEHMNNAWCETQPAFTWPVLATDEQRWQVRASIDVVVANAYGLNKEQYAHVLSTFSHKSYPKAPHLCLAMFDELQSIGLDAFMRKYDPYWDIPLNENLPKPVIDLPIPEASDGTGAQQPSLFADTDAR